MGRDVKNLQVFHVADQLVLDVYAATRGFPPEERYGLQGQLRRAAVSTPSNLVEGCARQSTRDYLRFVEISLGSASEARYLFTVADRLGFTPHDRAVDIGSRYEYVVKALQKLLTSLQEIAAHDEPVQRGERNRQR
jgi:four helix bundle protein